MIVIKIYCTMVIKLFTTSIVLIAWFCLTSRGEWNIL